MKLTYDLLEQLCELVLEEEDMRAWLTLKEPADAIEYELEALLQYLQEKGICQGIAKHTLKRAIREKQYETPILAAEGMAAQAGQDGWYEFYFETDLKSCPVTREDGSVDYLNMKLFEEAQEGQLLARYHPASKGMYGYTVRKKILKAQNGKNQPPLRGSGFLYDAEKQEYRAKIDGRIVYEGNYLQIHPLLVLEEVSYSTGNVKFSGDVLVKEGVRSGVCLEAGGDITINGSVECATIVSGGNVLLKQGATTDSKGIIRAAGNISGKFFEAVTIEAGESVYSDYYLNCVIQAEKEVVTTGKRGSLAGGETYCGDRVSVVYLGNRAGVATKVCMAYEPEAEQEPEKEQEPKKQSRIIVAGTAYGGCRIAFGETEKYLTEAQRELTFSRVGADNVMEAL
jgi:uncharacterized protein (DUF342 family)